MPGPGCPVQVMDLYTTSRGLKAGAYETNSAIRTGNAGTAIALKAAPWSRPTPSRAPR